MLSFYTPRYPAEFRGIFSAGVGTAPDERVKIHRQTEEVALLYHVCTRKVLAHY